jgi:hypothetical protein
MVCMQDASAKTSRRRVVDSGPKDPPGSINYAQCGNSWRLLRRALAWVRASREPSLVEPAHWGERSMTAKKKGPAEGRVRVKILPKDPLVARRNDLWPVEVDLPCATPGSGPTGPHAVVVDYDSDLDRTHAPARLLRNRSFLGIARLSNAKILDDFHFHQVNAWAIVERTLALIEDEYLMARAVPWAFPGGRLTIRPHARREKNAFYERASGSLQLCWFDGPGGKPVYTCLSHDIVAHELGHAVLDGLKPLYNEVSSAQTAGFHEYFGDAVAMMASLATRETALVVARGAPERLAPKNVVSAIASEFGAAVRRLPKQEYLRGAWNRRTMEDLRDSHEEHDWSEVLTGIYYDLLSHLYPAIRRQLAQQDPDAEKPGMRVHYSMRALSRAATMTAGVMFRGLDYCPPVDLRYDEYARAVLRADEVAYPLDEFGIRKVLARLFRRRGLQPAKHDRSQARAIQLRLRGIDIGAIAATPADAYRFLDEHRTLFGIPYAANFSVTSVYSTNKQARSGYRPPREHIMEFAWHEDVALAGGRFGELSGTTVALLCGGTLVFDSNGNFLHLALCAPSERRRSELKDYVAYLVRTRRIATGAAAAANSAASIRAVIANGRTRLERIAAMRHRRPAT